MSNIILVTGLSGSGKTTFADRVGSREGHCTINLGKLMRNAATREGFETLTHYMEHYETAFGFSRLRSYILNKISQQSPHEVIVDGIYDYGLYLEISEKFGRDNIFTVSLELEEEKRLMRFLLRSTREHGDIDNALISLRRRDTYKREVGIAKVIENADINLTSDLPVEQLVQVYDNFVRDYY